MKYLMIGLGGIGQRHLRNLLTISSQEDEFLAYRVRNEQFVLDNKLQVEKNRTLNETYHLRIFDDLDKALAERPDIVFICNPTSLHMETMIKAAKNGCHFFVEKPISHNLDHLDLLCELIRKNKIITYVGYQQRYNPCIKIANKIIENKELEEILSINEEIGECVRNWHQYEDYRRMYACRKELGGGVVLSQIHELDYLYYFFGMPVSVYAIGGHISNLEIDVEDVVDILLKYQHNGKTIPVHIHEDYIQNPASRTCKIVGTRGRIEFDLINPSLLQYDEYGNCVSREQYEFERNDMFQQELYDFVQSVKEKKETAVPLETGIKSLRIADAILQSIATEQIVYLR